MNPSIFTCLSKINKVIFQLGIFFCSHMQNGKLTLFVKFTAEGFAFINTSEAFLSSIFAPA